MVAPVNSRVAVDSGVDIYAGRFAPSQSTDLAGGGSTQFNFSSSGSLTRPAWRQAVAANTWAQVPASNTMASLDPKFNPAMWANPAIDPPWYGNTYVGKIRGWNSAVWDEGSQKLYLFLCGGHGDYGNNEPIRIQLDVEQPAFEMFGTPSGIIGQPPITEAEWKNGSNDGTLPDGKPRASHTYNNQVWVPGVGPMLMRQIGPYPSTGDVRKAWALDTDTGLYSLWKDWSVSSLVGDMFSATAYDPVRHCVWLMSPGSAQLHKFDIATKAVTRHGTYDNHVGGYPCMRYIPEHDILVLITIGGPGYVDAGIGLSTINLSTFAHTVGSYTGSFAAGYTIAGHGGVIWDEDNERLLLWNNSTNQTQISTLTPTGNLASAPWVAGALTVDPSNTVTPTPVTPNGIFGRFFYSRKMGGVFVLNSVSESLYFYALD